MDPGERMARCGVAVVETRGSTRTSLSRADRIVARCLPSVGDLVFASVLIGVLLGKQGYMLDGDSAWNLRIGTTILESGIPRTEFMLGTSLGQPHIYWEWLAQVLYALGLRVGGLNGVVAVASLLIALTGLSLYVILRRRGVPLLAAMGLAFVGVSLTTIIWTARAQLFTLPILLWWTEQIWHYWRSGGPRRLWFFPVTMVLWANLHGGFIEGLLTLGAAVAVAWLFPHARGRANPRHLTAALAASLAATLLIPWGVGLDLHVLEFLRNPVIGRYTNEYQSPDFHQLHALWFLGLAFLLVAAWIWRARRTGTMPEPLAFALAGLWTALAFYSVRFIPLWGLVTLPMLADALVDIWRARAAGAPGASDTNTALVPPLTLALNAGQQLLSGLGRISRRVETIDRIVGKGVWAGLGLLFVAVLLRGGALPGMSTRLLDAHYGETYFPVQAAERLHQQGLPAGAGFTTFEWGSYLDEALPEYHPFVDSRSDVEAPQLLLDYLTISSLGPGWQQTLDHYAVAWALLPRAEPLAQALALLPAWRCAPADEQGVAVLCTRSRVAAAAEWVPSPSRAGAQRGGSAWPS
jgi:hypothetical protein